MAIIPSAGQNKIEIQTPESKKQKKMLMILAVVVIAIILVIYFGFGSSSPTEESFSENSMPTAPTAPTGQISASAVNSIISLEETKLDFSVLSDPRFQALKNFEAALDISGEKGRTNPFLPY